MAIRYDKNLQKEIKRTVSNFNQKIARLEKLDKNLLLPERASIKRIKSQATSRAELKRMLASLQRYSARGVEETIETTGGLSISRYEFEETARSLRRVKANLSRQINKLGNTRPTVFGIKQDATYAQMGSEQLANLKARRYSLDFVDLKSATREMYNEVVKKIEFNINKEKYKKEIFMDNFVDKMLLNLGYFVEYDQEKMNYIKEKLTQLDEKEFMELYNTDLTIQAIKDYYPETSRQFAKPDNIREDVSALYDELYKNIDSMIADYM